MAKKNKTDGYYALMSDIEQEMCEYQEHFKDKVILCNCDDPYESGFFKHFALCFKWIGLKKLIAVGYIDSPIAYTEMTLEQLQAPKKRAYKIEMTEFTDENQDTAYNFKDIDLMIKNKNILTFLDGDGDFRSPECIELLKEADVVVTFPPSSLFKEFVKLMGEYDKKFIVIGNVNAVSTKEIVKLLRENKVYIDEFYRHGFYEFRVLDPDFETTKDIRVDKDGKRYIKDKSWRWFTNLESKQLKKAMEFSTFHSIEKYPKYENYDAYHIDDAFFIPHDYYGVVGLPLKYLEEQKPDQIEIIGVATSSSYNKEVVGLEKNPNIKEGRPLLKGKTYSRVFVRQKRR
jgi:hypothetical protein